MSHHEDPVLPTTPDDDAREMLTAQLASERTAWSALIDALPECALCRAYGESAPATNDAGKWEEWLICDGHPTEVTEVRHELGYAKALRAVLALEEP